MRRLTLHKLEALKALMLSGYTVRQALRILKLGGSTYSKYARYYVWGDKEFVKKLLLLQGITTTELPEPELKKPEPDEFKRRLERLKRLLRPHPS